ncbi:MAG: DUF481 domain-containing protein [Deltaproteobacteria bacterium]|nr:DUF481 domain-containing protein [Deltaproteobacteria bacterium]
MTRRLAERWSVGALACAAILIGGATTAWAQPEAATQHEEQEAERPSESDTRLTLTLGGTLNYGNTRSVAANIAAGFVLRRAENVLTLDFGWVYGYSSVRADDEVDFPDWEETANNLTGRARYDRFLTDDDALFIVARARRDQFAGLDSRLTGQVGYLRNLFNEEKHRFWLEVGYDLTYDNFFPNDILVDGETDRIQHSARLFIGYDNRTNDTFTYTTGLETLMDVQEPGHLRMEWLHQVRAKIASWLELSWDTTFRFDSLPPGQTDPFEEDDMQRIGMFDVTSTLNLVGTWDMDDEEPAAPAEPETPPTPECPECQECQQCQECPACPSPPPAETPPTEPATPPVEAPPASPPP